MDVPQPVPLPGIPFQPVNEHLPVEDWLQQRLISQFDPVHHAHYDYSLYGSVNALLSTQFPLSRKFIVKPQALLWESDDAFNFALRADTSGGASGSKIPTFPDFVVVRAHEQLLHEWIVCVVGIKREGQPIEAAEEQLIQYLERACNERWKVGILRGFLIVGSICRAFYVDTTQANVSVEHAANYELGATHGIEFKQALFRIARKYWGDAEHAWGQNDFVGPYE